VDPLSREQNSGEPTNHIETNGRLMELKKQKAREKRRLKRVES
jgi:hypothetical protein